MMMDEIKENATASEEKLDTQASEQQQKKHGGKRAGAGRKSLQKKLNGYYDNGAHRSTEATVIGVRIPQILLSSFIKENGGGAFLRELFFEYCCTSEGNARVNSFIRDSVVGAECKREALNIIEEVKETVKKNRQHRRNNPFEAAKVIK